MNIPAIEEIKEWRIGHYAPPPAKFRTEAERQADDEL